MDDAQRDQFRAQIEAAIATTQKDIERLETSAAPVSPDNAIGRLTRMDSLNDQGLGTHALAQKREKLYDLEKALELLGHPDFGRCIICKRPIPIERLMALPETKRCVACASH